MRESPAPGGRGSRSGPFRTPGNLIARSAPGGHARSRAEIPQDPRGPAVALPGRVHGDHQAEPALRRPAGRVAPARNPRPSLRGGTAGRAGKRPALRLRGLLAVAERHFQDRRDALLDAVDVAGRAGDPGRRQDFHEKTSRRLRAGPGSLLERLPSPAALCTSRVIGPAGAPGPGTPVTGPGAPRGTP
jgi:hypothetical protein